MTDFDPLAGYVSDFKGRRILVLGDAILDEYLHRRVQPDFARGAGAGAEGQYVQARARRRREHRREHRLPRRARNADRAGRRRRGRTDAPALCGRRRRRAAGRRSRAANAAQDACRLRSSSRSSGSITKKTSDSAAPSRMPSWRDFRPSVDRCDVVVISDYAQGIRVGPLASRDHCRRARRRPSGHRRSAPAEQGLLLRIATT